MTTTLVLFVSVLLISWVATTLKYLEVRDVWHSTKKQRYLAYGSGALTYSFRMAQRTSMCRVLQGTADQPNLQHQDCTIMVLAAFHWLRFWSS